MVGYENAIQWSEEKMNWDSFRFIDLFAGIGGIRLGFESVGGHCVFSSELMKLPAPLMRQILVNILREILPR